MLEKLFYKIEHGQDVRGSLITMREILKGENGRRAVRELQPDKVSLLTGLLESDDPKTRRAAAYILGENRIQDAARAIFRTYQKEETLFIRADLLRALSGLNYRFCMADLQQIFEEKKEESQAGSAGSSAKHLAAEIKALRDMLMDAAPARRHHFTGWNVDSTVILLTSAGLEQLTFDQLSPEQQERAGIVRGGVRVHSERLQDLMQIRTVKGMLFRICANPLPDNSPEAAAQTLINSNLQDFIACRHSGTGPYYFRIDLRTKLFLTERSRYIARLAAAIERRSAFVLQNSASDYEFEIRLTEGRSGRYSVYLQINTIPDDRFSYRRNAPSVSMHPVKAAEMISLAEPWLDKDAIVLDPMCGTGTLLIERRKRLQARSLYGVDSYGEMVRMGRENARAAGVMANFINRDFHDFSHEYSFDEIITELPAVGTNRTLQDLAVLYQDFIRRVPVWMGGKGILAVCAPQADIFQRAADAAPALTLLLQQKLSGKRGDQLFVYQYTRK